MPDKESYSEMISRYLLYEMDEQEKADFEKQISEDPELAKEVEFMREMFENISAGITFQEVLNDPGREQARELVRKHFDNADIAPEPETEKYSPGRRAVHYMLAAAVVAFLIVAGILISRDPEAGRLYAQYYNPYHLKQSGISTETPTGAILAQSILNYNQGNYEVVIAALTDLEKQQFHEDLPPESTFTLGLAYMAVQDYPNAVITFREHLDQQSEYETEASWYLGLSLLKEGNTASAKSIFSKLAASKNPFSRKAAILSRKIDKMMD